MNSGFTLNRFSAFAVERPSLDQFVLLSLMLHVLVIVLFGDTVGGGVRRGEKLWGALTVTVQNLLPERGGGLKSDPVKTILHEPRIETKPAPASSATPADAAATSAPEKPVEEKTPSSPASSFEMPPVIATEVDKPVTEFVVPKAAANRAPNPATLTPESARPEPVGPSKIEPVLATPLAPLISFTPIPPLATPRVDAVAVPVPLPQTPAPVTLVAEPLPAKIEREIVKPVVVAPEPKPREITQLPAPVVPIAPVTPAKAEPERVQAIAPPEAAAPREIPVAVQPTPTPAVPSALQSAEATKAPQIEREAATTPAAPPTVGKPTPARTPATASGAASSEGDVQKPRGEAIAPTVNAPVLGKSPGIDLDAVRRRAREISGGGPRTVFPFPVAPQPVPKTKVQEAFDKALKKNDCRDAYADMGLAAVVPLVLSAVRDDGCRW